MLGEREGALDSKSLAHLMGTGWTSWWKECLKAPLMANNLEQVKEKQTSLKMVNQMDLQIARLVVLEG